MQNTKKKLTIFILDHSGMPIKEFSISKRIIFFSFFLCVMMAVALSYLLHDYYDINKQLITKSTLQEKIKSQKEIIDQQNIQIKKFASEINQVKDKLVALNNFEKRIRIMANIEDTNEDNGLFGIGGAFPEDLKPNINSPEQNNILFREMHSQIGQLDSAHSGQQVSFENLLNHLQDQKNLLACTPTISPTEGWITSNFGYRTSPFTGRRAFHKGLDIANKKNASVFATADGKVTYTGKKGLLGRIVVIDHGHGLITRYGHLGKILKKRGDIVKRGDVIGQIGLSGRTTGPHVHYEVHLNGIPVNPKKYILN